MLSFPKSKRLLKRKQYREVFDLGTKVVNRDLVVFARPHQEGQARIGLVVSKKVGNAVTRNRVKRLLRERFRHRQDQLPDTDLVIIARHRTADIATTDLWNSFDDCIRRLKARSR